MQMGISVDLPYLDALITPNTHLQVSLSEELRELRCGYNPDGHFLPPF